MHALPRRLDVDEKNSDRLVAGEASPSDIETLESVAYQIDGRTICAFGEASSWPVAAITGRSESL